MGISFWVPFEGLRSLELRPLSRQPIVSRRHILVWLASSLFCSLNGCKSIEKKAEEISGMSKEQVEKYIESLGGQLLVNGKPPIKLEQGFDVSAGLGGISVSYAIRDKCKKYCWTQVVQKFLDGKVIEKPSQLDPNPTPQEMADPNFPDYKKQDERITPDGSVVDHLCHPTQTGPGYIDDPGFPDSLFERNAINKNAEVFVAKFELCLRCDDPPDTADTWRHCLRWYIVKIRGVKGVDTYLVTTDASADDKPSAEFKRAVEKWTH